MESRLPFNIKLLAGESYTVRWGRRDMKTRGYVDLPHKKGEKVFVIRRGLPPQDEIEIFGHELLHVHAPSMDEEYVIAFGLDLAELLWKAGYRRMTTPEAIVPQTP